MPKCSECEATWMETRPYGKCSECEATWMETRPYGKDGAPICFKCAMKPENRTRTGREFAKALDKAGPIAVVGTEDGPVALDALESVGRKAKP